MQQRPDTPTTLDAIVRFLLADLQPTVTDKALSFRVLIAANALSQCAQELRAEPQRSISELDALHTLMPDFAVRTQTTDQGRWEAIAALERELCERIRDGRLSAAENGAAMLVVRLLMRETLKVTNPRFDLADTIE
jgi:hypothetical protein